MDSILTLLIVVPLAGALLVALTPQGGEGRAPRIVAGLVTLLEAVLGLIALRLFDVNASGYQLVERVDWIPSLGVQYFVGIDGISLVLVLLTVLLMPLVVLASPSVTKGVHGYLINMLLLEAGMVGTLVALDLFLFYIFWELMLFPMYFIIGIWGGARRIYASLKFVIYTAVGSLLMLAAIFYLFWAHVDQVGIPSFQIDHLIHHTALTTTEELWLFAAFALAFAIKVPLFPFHTWLPDAHVEAPTGGSVVLAGVLLKLGVYGFLRFGYPLFPRAAEEFAPWIAGLAVVGIIYGALVAWVQTDIKKLVAYSSVSHLGYCMLGLAAFTGASLSGTVFQLIAHGVSTGALFLLVGVLYDRAHTRELSAFGGLAGKMPVFAAIFLVITLSSIALPLTNGFVGEFLILSGSFTVYPWLTTAALLGVVLGAVYMLTAYLKVCFGEGPHHHAAELVDMTTRERLLLAPFVIAAFVMGLFPGPTLEVIDAGVRHVEEQIAVRQKVIAASDVPTGAV